MPTRNIVKMDSNDIEVDEGEATSEASAPAPRAIVVTNVATEIFEDEKKQKEFEGAFLAIDPNASFNYFKSFTRARVNFSCHNLASTACHLFDLSSFEGKEVRCYLTQPIVVGSGAPHLLPPKREKQFLISPPASPPPDWQPANERQPLVSYDILSALADLAPGEAHELHPASCSQPGIVVHVCEEHGDADDAPCKHIAGVRLPQTARPGHAQVPVSSD